jgi:SAM-dependent methyltransferase
VFGRATEPFAQGKRAGQLARSLQAEFSIDSVITFSDAWSYWESLSDFLHGAPIPKPLDQQLFRGSHPKSSEYFQGIETLAHRYAEHVRDWLRASLPRTPVQSMLDLGAGPGIYARTLIAGEVASAATCVDFDYVTRRAQTQAEGRISTVSSDLFRLGLPNDQSFDLIYVGNVLHHYTLCDNVRLFRRVRRNVAPDAYLVVQEYLLEDWPTVSPVYAAILGVHFALTSPGGRCYSPSEISCVVGQALPGFRYVARHNLGASDLLLYWCHRQ